MESILRKKKRGSNRYQLLKNKVLERKRHVANMKVGYIHKITSEIIKQYQHIYMETISIMDLEKRGKAGSSLHYSCWGIVVEQLKFKAKKSNRHIHFINPYFPSSKICHFCGYKNDSTADIRVRTIECPQCHHVYDRDINAAINILKRGKQETNNY